MKYRYMKADLTVIILTKNEEKNIEDCIASVVEIAKRIIVVDSYSDDQTVKIASKMNAEIYQHKFETHARQFMYAVNISNITTKWILKLDADERMTEETRNELVQLCNKNSNTDINGIILRFKKNFLGKDLYHGGVYPWKKLSCYKTDHGFIEDRAMDEHIVLKQGKSITMKNDCLHLDFKNLEFFINKHNWYSSKETSEYFKLNNTKNSNEKVNIKTWIKNSIYYKLPIGMRAHFYYIYRYYFKLGFLDGKEGKIYAFMQAYWYRYLVDAKIYECKKLKIKYREIGDLK